MSQVIVHIYKLSHPALGTKLRFAKFKHDRLHIALLVNQSKLSFWNLREKRTTVLWHDILELFVTQCTLVKKMAQCTLVKCNAFW